MASKLKLTVPREEAVALIRQALPKDAIVRDHDDAIGRFASVRVVMIVGRGAESIALINGAWRDVKARASSPHVKVDFEDSETGCTALLEVGEVKKPGLMSKVWEALGQVALVAAAMVLYYRFRGLELDYTRVALVSVAAGVGWSVISHFLPTKKEAGLDELVKKALKPVRKKKKKKKKAEPELESEAKPETETETEPDPEAADRASPEA